MFTSPSGFVVNDEILPLRPRPTHRQALLTRRTATLAVATVVTLLGLAACSSPAKTTPTPSSVSSSPAAGVPATATGSAQAVSVIMIKDFKYTTPASVAAGSMVGVMNADSQNHTVTADTGKAFDDQATAGATSMFKAPMTPGTYAFHCTYHANMHGVLIVK